MAQHPDASHPPAISSTGAYVEDPAGDPIDVIYPATGKSIARLRAATPANGRPGGRVGEGGAGRLGTGQRRRTRPGLAARGRDHPGAQPRSVGAGNPRHRQAAVRDAGRRCRLGRGRAGVFRRHRGGDHGRAYPGRRRRFRLYDPGGAGGLRGASGRGTIPPRSPAGRRRRHWPGGNAMVFKPSETTPLCALKIAEILVEAGGAARAFSMSSRAPARPARRSSPIPCIAKVSLTGSGAHGAKGGRPRRRAGIRHVTMELGGKSAADSCSRIADLDTAVSGAILGNFYSSGQVCSNGTRVFVQAAPCWRRFWPGSRPGCKGR